MLRSKSILIFILGTSLWALTACTKSQSPDPTPSNPTGKNMSAASTIYIDDCRGDGFIKPIDRNASWAVPNVATISYSVCLRDRATKQPMRGHHFEIETEDGKRYFPDCPQRKKTGDLKACVSDASGCITWTEDKKFNYYAKQSGTLEVSRKVIATGINAADTVSFYVNPWAMDNHDKRDSGNSVMCSKKTAPPPDLIVATNPRAQEDLLSSDKDGGAEIWMDNVSFNIISRQKYGEGELYEFEVNGTPKIKWYDHNGKVSYHDIDDGEFTVFAHLVATDTGPDQRAKMILTAGEMATWAHVENGIFHTTLRTSLERRTSIGNVTLVLRLVPRNYGGMAPLKEFFGIFELGNIKDFKDGSHKGVLARYCWAKDRDQNKCNWNNYLRNADNWDRFLKMDIAFKNKPLLFSTLRLRFVTIAAFPVETATRRTVTYSASTCVSDRAGNRLVHVPFIVEYVDEKGKSELPSVIDEDDQVARREAAYVKQRLVTDDEGCLRWLAHVSHEYYKQEEFITKNVKIQMLNENPVTVEPDPYAIEDSQGNKPETKSVDKAPAGDTLTFLLNPWDDKFTFGFDKREVSEAFLEETKMRPKPESRFFTGGYGYHTISFRYDIDKYMNLEVKKTILLEVDPRVLRYSGIVNARRTTENLRDGIYLLKVGIQKSFLDPATPGVRIYPRPGQKNRADANKTCGDTPNSVPCHEYISTKTTLVRVVDGRLIKPIELTMHDLRLMRLRSNFMIELELVDEHKLNLDKALQDEFRRLSAINLEEVQKYRDQFKCPDDSKCEQEYLTTGKTPYDPLILKQKYKARQAETIAKLESAFNTYNSLLNEDESVLTPRNSLNEDLRKKLDAVDKQLREKLDAALQTNDFTRLPLADCDLDRDHCDRFLEKDSEGRIDNIKTKPWLKARTFVGPVIFLSNAYSDAVRATDNLDEACRSDNRFLEEDQRKTYGLFDPSKDLFNAPADPENKDDPPENQLFALQPDKEVPTALASLPEGTKVIFNSLRENKDYRYWPYFGRLTQFCGRQVDYFIEREGQLREQYVLTMEHDSSLENFVNSFNMDFAILNENNNKEFKQDQNRIGFNDLMKEMNTDSKVQVNPSVAYDLLTRFDRQKATDEEIEPVCHLLVNHALSNLKDLERDHSANNFVTLFWKSQFGANFPIDHPGGFKSDLLQKCIQYARDPSPETASIIVDKKYRIFKTGTDYTFKGGLQINLNVGNQVSISRGSSKSAGTEVIDYLDTLVGAGLGWLVGGPLGAIIGGVSAVPGQKIVQSESKKYGGTIGAIVGGMAIKPISIKPSESIGDSEGTSISAQTYLVGQIAKFDVELQEYEMCQVLRLSPSVMNQPWYISWAANVDPKLRNQAGATLEHLISRGVLVCDGTKTERSIRVPEDYFYFTQHFTEGDMLDQGDLLNHPWLMSMRGDRDFGVFIRLMNAKEDTSWIRFYKGAVGYEKPRDPDWPLEKLASVFKATTPTFPGIYTLLSPEEHTITGFPIGNRMIVIDKDINGEKCNIPERCPGQYDGYRTRSEFRASGSRPLESTDQ
jgi:hypothetical protein